MDRIARMPDGQETTIRVSSRDAISDMKEKIRLKCGVVAKQLYFNETLLKEKDNVSEYNLKAIFITRAAGY